MMVIMKWMIIVLLLSEGIAKGMVKGLKSFQYFFTVNITKDVNDIKGIHQE